MKHEVHENGVSMLADMKRRAVRLHHPTLRNCQYTVMDAGIRYHSTPQGWLCPQCAKFHEFKTFHLTINVNGDVVVSEEIYRMFKERGLMGELKAVKEVVPRPFAVEMPFSDFSAKPLLGSNDYADRGTPVHQPPIVISREEGMVKGPGKKER